MENCKCWELQPKATYVGEYHGCKIYRNKQICNGTREREECSCDGDESKCNFYPEKRKESKSMNTAEMFVQSQKDGKFYKCKSNYMVYQKDRGLINIINNNFDRYGELYGLDFDNLMELNWEVWENAMTKSEAEARFNIKIVGD